MYNRACQSVVEVGALPAVPIGQSVFDIQHGHEVPQLLFLVSLLSLAGELESLLETSLLDEAFVLTVQVALASPEITCNQQPYCQKLVNGASTARRN
jgi:hypothetical protein